MAKWVKSLGTRTLEELLAQYRQDHPTWPEELLQPMCESKKQLDPTTLDVVSARMHSEEWSWRTTLHQVIHPVLLLTGNPELGGIVTPEVVARARELKPDIVVVTIPDVGHLIRFDKYPVFMEALWTFLKQVSS